MESDRRASISSIDSEHGSPISTGRRMSGADMIEKIVLGNARNFHCNLDGFNRDDYVKPIPVQPPVTMKDMLKRQKILREFD